MRLAVAFSALASAVALAPAQPGASGLRPDLHPHPPAMEETFKLIKERTCKAPENEGVFLSRALPDPTPEERARCAKLMRSASAT